MSLILANTNYLEEEIRKKGKYEIIFLLFIDASASKAAGFWTESFFSPPRFNWAYVKYPMANFQLKNISSRLFLTHSCFCLPNTHGKELHGFTTCCTKKALTFLLFIFATGYFGFVHLNSFIIRSSEDLLSFSKPLSFHKPWSYFPSVMSFPS